MQAQATQELPMRELPALTGDDLRAIEQALAQVSVPGDRYPAGRAALVGR
jgi:hypothetical protein